MKKIFITATDTDIGKTYTLLKLLQTFSELGYKAASFKPIETGVKETPIDGLKHFTLSKRLNPKLATLSMKDIVPITMPQPAAPFVANGGKKIDLDPIFSAVKKFENRCDVLLIEGAGGLYVPINEDYFMIDLIRDLHVNSTLLVTHCSLGCINDTILSQKALKEYSIPFVTAFNCKNGENFAQTSMPYFNATGENVLIIDKESEKIAKRLLKIVV